MHYSISSTHSHTGIVAVPNGGLGSETRDKAMQVSLTESCIVNRECGVEMSQHWQSLGLSR